MRLLPPTVLILAPAAIGAAGAGMVYAQPRASVLILSEADRSSEGPSPSKFADALRRGSRARPLVLEGSGVMLGAEGRVAEGAETRARAALDRGREYLRLLQLPEAESAFGEVLRELRAVGTPSAWEMRAQADVALAVVLLESGRREAALRAFIEALRHDPALQLDPVRHSPFVREALDQARATIALLPRGRLRVETVPADLDVWIDGRHAGRSPAESGDLVSGEHVVAVAGGWSRAIGVPAGETARITVLPGGGAPAEVALDVARAVDADRVVVLSEGPEGRIRGRVLDVPTGRLGVARESDSEEALATALEEELGFRAAGVPGGNGRTGTDRGERAPWYESWWVYAIGVGLVGGAITAMAVAGSGEPPTDDLPTK